MWGIVVTVIVVVGIIWWLSSGTVPATAPTTSSNTAPQSAVPSKNTATDTTIIAPQDNSDVSLNQDLSSIESQMNGLTSDSQSIDQGLNDQPISQGQ